jgi:EAL domain-containing protein (putative c-di-GMP-specific phosphodiesterase class I)
VSAALNRLQPGLTLEATATAICEGLISLPGIDLAGIINFLGPERAVPLAVAGPANAPFAAGTLIPTSRAAHLYQRAQRGPWADVFEDREVDPLREQLERFGLQASAYAPIHNGEQLLGVVVASTRDPMYALHLIEHVPVVSEFAATASALLSAQINADHDQLRAREHIEHVLAEHGFHPLFQPIVDLASGEPVGFEALTRFADGTPPDRMIAEAHKAGLGVELEIACLRAALDASETLPAGAWLSLNAAPIVILQANDLAALLDGRQRRLVLEVTEHAPIDDYAALRQAVMKFGVDLAVDDAGSGFASMQHIVELAPRYLKLDVSLVRHVDRDLTRQAMAAGLCHFASRIGCEVIAEGIEDADELATLRTLGVPLGQGYLLGRPEPPPAMP